MRIIMHKQAEDIINNSSNPNLNAQDITNALNNIKQAQDNLHGAQNYSKTKIQLIKPLVT